MQESPEENVEEPGQAELEESPGNHVGFSVEDVREALGEMTQEMLVKLQVYTLEQITSLPSYLIQRRPVYKKQHADYYQQREQKRKNISFYSLEPVSTRITFKA